MHVILLMALLYSTSFAQKYMAMVAEFLAVA